MWNLKQFDSQKQSEYDDYVRMGLWIAGVMMLAKAFKISVRQEECSKGLPYGTVIAIKNISVYIYFIIAKRLYGKHSPYYEHM